MVQDLPPAGGYDPIQWKRNLPSTGIRPSYLFAGTLLFMGYGWYRLAQGMRENRELVRERTWARIYMTPLLMAEQDRDSVRRYYSDKKREAEIMKDVPGWIPKQSVYNDGKFRNPNYSYLDD